MMEIMEVTTMLGTLLGSLTAVGGFGVFMYRKQNKRLKELEVKQAETNVAKARIETQAEDWHIWKEQNDALFAQNKALIDRNNELIASNREKEDAHQQDIKDWEARFTDQTRVLRDTQREFRDTLNKQIDQERVIGDLREENAYLLQWLCKDADCDHGKPPRERLKGKRFDSRRCVHKTCAPDCNETPAKDLINVNINENV